MVGTSSITLEKVEDLWEETAEGEPDQVDVVEAERTDEADSILRHRVNVGRHTAGSATDIPVIDGRCEVAEERQRNTRVGPESSVGESDAVGPDVAGWRPGRDFHCGAGTGHARSPRVMTILPLALPCST